MWRVPQLDEDYIARMEDVLATYKRPYNPTQLAVCLDEKPVTLHADVRPATPAVPGYRWGQERGFLVVDGQKTKIGRPQVRSTDGHEQTLGSYELFRRGEPLDEAVWDELMLGLSTRNYGKALREFAEGVRYREVDGERALHLRLEAQGSRATGT